MSFFQSHSIFHFSIIQYNKIHQSISFIQFHFFNLKKINLYINFLIPIKIFRNHVFYYF